MDKKDKLLSMLQEEDVKDLGRTIIGFDYKYTNQILHEIIKTFFGDEKRTTFSDQDIVRALFLIFPQHLLFIITLLDDDVGKLIKNVIEKEKIKEEEDESNVPF